MNAQVVDRVKPPFYAIILKKTATKPIRRTFVVVKKSNIVRAAVNGLMDVTGFWDEDYKDMTDLENREFCSIIIPVCNVDFIKNLMYRPR
jgi:hypothetical protein